MPFVASYKYEQLFDTPTVLRITDTSTSKSTFSSIFDDTFYQDGFVSTRKIYIRKADGAYLVPKGTETDYIQWDIVNSIDLDILDKDYALEIKIEADVYFYPTIFDNSFSSIFN